MKRLSARSVRLDTMPTDLAVVLLDALLELDRDEPLFEHVIDQLRDEAATVTTWTEHRESTVSIEAPEPPINTLYPGILPRPAPMEVRVPLPPVEHVDVDLTPLVGAAMRALFAVTEAAQSMPGVSTLELVNEAKRILTDE